jgi:hypothetical protein
MFRLYQALFGVVLICWGAVGIFSPATLEKLTLRLSGLAKTSSPRTPRPSELLSRRFIGVLAFAVGAYFLQLALRAHHFIATQPHVTSPPPANLDWQSLAFSAAGVIFGSSLIVRPRILNRLVERNFPAHKLSLETSGSTAIAARLIGTLVVLFEIYQIYLLILARQ